jgi:hypothetical protein
MEKIPQKNNRGKFSIHKAEDGIYNSRNFHTSMRNKKLKDYKKI